MGIDARRALVSGAAGKVAAAFRRSLYLELPAGWVCVGAAEIGNGPVNVPCRLGPADWRSVGEGAPACRVGEQEVRIEGSGHIELSGIVWKPAAPPAWTPGSLVRGLDALERLLPRDVAGDGLACFAWRSPDPTNFAAEAATAPVGALRRWLVGDAVAGVPEAAVAELLGLGPGLTPSGDDLLAGCLVALRTTGHAAEADALWRVIDARGPAATNAISFAHLASAARGTLSEKLHHTLDAVLAGDGDALEGALRRLAGEDHSSPWDGLAGIVLALEPQAAGRA